MIPAKTDGRYSENTFFIASLISSAFLADGNISPQFGITLYFWFRYKADENGIKQGGAELDTGLVLFQVSLAQKLQPEMDCLIMIPHVLATEAE